MVSKRKRLQRGEGQGTSEKEEKQKGKGEGGIPEVYYTLLICYTSFDDWILFTGNVYVKTFLLSHGHREADRIEDVGTADQGSYPESHYSLSVAMSA